MVAMRDHCPGHGCWSHGTIPSRIERQNAGAHWRKPHEGRTFPVRRRGWDNKRASIVVRTEVLASLHDAEIVPVEHTVLLKILPSLQEAEEGGEEALELVSVDLIHDRPHLPVRRDRFNTPEIPEIGTECGGPGALLELEQGGILEAEHGKDAHTDILKLVAYLLGVTMVGNTGEVLEQYSPYSGESEMERSPHAKTILH